MDPNLFAFLFEEIHDLSRLTIVYSFVSWYGRDLGAAHWSVRRSRCRLRSTWPKDGGAAPAMADVVVDDNSGAF
jgi:hypothetical protein